MKWSKQLTYYRPVQLLAEKREVHELDERPLEHQGDVVANSVATRRQMPCCYRRLHRCEHDAYQVTMRRSAEWTVIRPSEECWLLPAEDSSGTPNVVDAHLLGE